MKLSAEEVRHMALLARLGLSDADVESFREQLSNILENFHVLQQIDTEGVPPTSHTVALRNVMRDDAPRPSLDVTQVMANAPEREDDYFKVHAVLE